MEIILMNADTFVDRLRAARPTREQLHKLGVSSDEAIKTLQDDYVCIRKPASARSQLDPVLDLISRYEVSQMRIGFVAFLERPTTPKDGKPFTIVGTIDADLIAINDVTGEIVLLDGCHRTCYVMSKIASDSGRLLDALIVFAEASHKSPPIQNIGKLCADASGEEESRNLFAMLAGEL